MTRGKELVERANAFGELVLKVNGIKVPHLDAPQHDSASLVVTLQVGPSYAHDFQVLIGLKAEDGGDPDDFLEFVDLFQRLGKRADKKLGENLVVIHSRVTIALPEGGRQVCVMPDQEAARQPTD